MHTLRLVVVTAMMFAPGCDATSTGTSAIGDDPAPARTDGEAEPGGDADETVEPDDSAGAAGTATDAAIDSDSGPASVSDVEPGGPQSMGPGSSTNPLVVENGWLPVPQGAGLGIALNWTEVEKQTETVI